MRLVPVFLSAVLACAAVSAHAVTQTFVFQEASFTEIPPGNQPATFTANRGLTLSAEGFNGPITPLYLDQRGIGPNTLVDTNGNDVALFCGEPGCSFLDLLFAQPVELISLELVLYTEVGANIDVSVAGGTLPRRFLPPTPPNELPQSFVLDYSGTPATQEISIRSGGSGAFSLAVLKVDDLVPIPLPGGLPLFLSALFGMALLRDRKRRT